MKKANPWANTYDKRYNLGHSFNQARKYEYISEKKGGL